MRRVLSSASSLAAGGRRRLSRQDGIAMVVVMSVLVVMLGLSALVMGVAGQLKTSSTTDRNAKHALAAADTGLRTARYQLNQVPPSQTCPDGSSPSGSWCGPYTNTYPLESDVTYTYSVTTPFTWQPNSGQADPIRWCAGVPVVQDATRNFSFFERCVTATGTSHGVTRRVQTRLVSPTASAIFPLPGIVGFDHVCLGCNFQPDGVAAPCGNMSIVGGLNAMSGSVGSNHGVKVSLKQGGTWTPAAAGVVMGANDACVNTGPLPNPNFSPLLPPGGFSRLPDDWPILKVDPNFQTGGSAGCGPSSGGDTAACHNDSSVTFSPAGAGCGLVGTRELDLTHNGCSATLPNGVYNFCSMNLGNNSRLEPLDTSAAANVSIYLDSSARTGSPAACPASSSVSGGTIGALKIGNGAGLMDMACATGGSTCGVRGDQFYVYGNPANPGSNVLPLGNQGAFTMLVFAPSSDVQVQNSTSGNTTGGVNMKGGIIGWSVEMQNNGQFQWDPSVDQVSNSPTHVYYRQAWRECHKPFTASDPQSCP